MNRVDVLAVLDEAIDRLNEGHLGGRSDIGGRLDDARDAVAKLIEAAEYARNELNGPSNRGPSISTRFAISNSLRDAIAAVKGGAA